MWIFKAMNMVMMGGGCGKGVWDIVPSWTSRFQGDVNVDMDMNMDVDGHGAVEHRTWMQIWTGWWI